MTSAPESVESGDEMPWLGCARLVGQEELDAAIRSLRREKRPNRVASPVMLWNSVLFLGFGMAIDPLRLGLVVALLSRQRPMLNLLAFWLGGMVAGIGVGMAALVLMRDTALLAFQSAASTIAGVRSSIAIFSGGRLQITIGVIALLSLAILTARQRARAAKQVPVQVGVGGLGDESAVAVQPRPQGLLARLGGITHDLLQRGFFWPAFLVGLGSATPPVETLVLLTVIMASGAAVGTQFGAFIVYTVMVLAVIEIPLLCYLAKPDRTQAVMLRLQNWIRVHRGRITQSAVGFSGVALVIQGIGSL